MKKIIMIFFILAIGEIAMGQTNKLLDTGKVGIGTLAPASLIHIKGDNYSGGDPAYRGDIIIDRINLKTTQATGGLEFKSDNFGNGYGWKITNIDPDATYYGVDNMPLVFSSRVNEGAWSDKIVIQANGNMGIGTINPGAYMLAVNGVIHSREVKVDLTGWSDFVFETDYKLRSLKETEQFIKANGHLPEIPSAAEVEKDGIKVGEMNAKLLQKIEELTLYLIESQKVVSDLNRRLSDLETSVNK